MPELSAQQGEEAEPTAKYSTSPPRVNGRCCVRFGRTRVLCSVSDRYGYFQRLATSGLTGAAYDMILGLKVALLVSICLTTISFTMVACSDPGVVFRTWRWLTTCMETSRLASFACEVRRPLNASHCSDCGVCVRELDHHCPWTGKCVGERTIKWFYVFLTFISLHCMLIGAVCLVTFVAR
ncbi:DHHC domain-containing protein [Phytophthora infestans]|uniref:Palmitoyltransferase n=1 Tax=Phytophthora infestans TaxID=4787 RepID=A0A833WHV6_PHYIN|nr:DHHC domain-containing protein [Phytophthora infestans]